MVSLKLPKFGGFKHQSGKDIVAIDFSGNSFKMAHLKVFLNKKELVKIISRNISGLSDDEVAKVIAGSFYELGARGADILSIMPSSAVISKNIEVPSVDQQEIKEIINLQAGRHTPYSREEIIVDYIEIGTYKNSYTKILLIIVARSVVKRQFEILQKAGLRLERVVLSAESLAWSVKNIFRMDTNASVVNLLHVDDTSTDFIIVFKDRPLFIRNIPIGTQHLFSPGEGQQQQLRFAEELKKSLEAYQNEDIEKIPNAIILSGAVEDMSSLEKLLNENLYIPTKHMPYFKFLSIAPSLLKSSSAVKNVSFLNAISALYAEAQMRINLVPEEVKLRKALEERGRELIKTGILILAIFVLVFSLLISKIYFKTAYLNKLDTKYNALNKQAGELEGNFSKVSLIRSYLASRGFSLEVLTELYNATPDDLELSDIRFDEQGKFFIRGTAETMSSVFAFVDNMQKSKYFKEVKTKYTTKRKEGLVDVTDFEVNCVLVKAKPND
jgi:Tfp pilus assembly PilM family ATPase